MKCRAPHLTDDEIKEAFVKTVNAVVLEKNELIANTEVMMRTLCDTTELETEQSRFLTEMETAIVMTEGVVAKNKTAIMNQDKYQKRYNELIAQHEAAKDRYEKVSEMIADRQGNRKVYMQFIGGLKRADDFFKDFDEELWAALLNHATVFT